MIAASSLKTGMVIRFEGHLYRVIYADFHSGQGKMGGVTHARLRSLESGTLWEHAFRAELKIEEVPVEKRDLDYLYSDGDQHWFMDPQSFEQLPISSGVIGPAAHFLKPDMRLTAEFVGDAAIGLKFCDVVEIVVANTDPPSRQQQDSTWKHARLENGLDIMVPPFIKTGDSIRLDIESMKYMERARTAAK